MKPSDLPDGSKVEVTAEDGCAVTTPAAMPNPRRHD
jgi:hypothetical protein